MTARFQLRETTVARNARVLRLASAEGAMVPQQASPPPLEQSDRSGRALRKWFIVANAVAWLLIILAIRLIFF